MAILDSTLEFCDAVSVAAAAGTTLIGNQINTSVVRDVGRGPVALYLNVTVDTAIITGGSAGTFRLKLASDDSASISTTTSTVHLQTGEYVTDDTPTIPAGSILFSGPIPSGIFRDNDYEQYLGILLVVTTTTITEGKINAWLSLDPIGWVAQNAAPV